MRYWPATFTIPIFPEEVAFVDVADLARTLTGDRKEFLGRNGSMSNPAALQQERLSGKTGVGLDPCGAMQVTLDLADGEEREIRFCLGAGRDLAHAQSLIERYREAGAVQAALEWRSSVLEANTWRGPGGNAGRIGQLDGQRLAAVSDFELSSLGTHRFLSIWWRIRISRSIARLDGARLRRTGP